MFIEGSQERMRVPVLVLSFKMDRMLYASDDFRLDAASMRHGRARAGE